MINYLNIHQPGFENLSITFFFFELEKQELELCLSDVHDFIKKNHFKL